MSLTTEELNAIFKALAEPFPPEDIEWKPQSPHQKGDTWTAMALPYLDARAIMDRLDAIIGPANWFDEYESWADGRGTKCSLHIRINEEWVVKEDVSDNPATEGIKGGVSNALKRAAVKWGIGRYLYSLPKYWVQAQLIGDPSKKQVKLIEYPLKRLPDWALPTGYKKDEANIRRALQHYGDESPHPPEGKAGTAAETKPETKVETKAPAAKAAAPKAPAAAVAKPAGTPAGKPAAEVVKETKAAAEAPASGEDKTQKMLARAREYIIPGNVPLAGTKLGDAVADAFGQGVVRFLAGTEANPAGQMFTPEDEGGKSLQAAAKFLLSKSS